MPVDRIEELGKDGAPFRPAAFEPVAQAGKDHEIGLRAQPGRSTEGLDQHGEVLLRHGSGDSEDDRLVRLTQEGRYQIACAVPGVLPDAGHLHARHDPVDAAYPGGRVGQDLPLAFVARGADDRRRGTDRAIFLGDPAIQLGCQFGSGSGDGSALVQPERMRGVDEGYSELALDLGGDVGGIGEVGVDDVRQAAARPQVREQSIDEGGTILRQGFLGQIARIAAVDAADHACVRNPFLALRMDRAEPFIDEAPCDDLRQLDIVPPRQRFHLAENIGDVAAGILGNSVLNRLCPKAASQRDRHDMQTRAPDTHRDPIRPRDHRAPFKRLLCVYFRGVIDAEQALGPGVRSAVPPRHLPHRSRIGRARRPWHGKARGPRAAKDRPSPRLPSSWPCRCSR